MVLLNASHMPGSDSIAIESEQVCIMCKKNASNNGEIISTENHVTLIMQLGCNLVMSIICNVVPAVRYLLVDHD